MTAYDRMIPPTAQRLMEKRAGSTIAKFSIATRCTFRIRKPLRILSKLNGATGEPHFRQAQWPGNGLRALLVYLGLSALRAIKLRLFQRYWSKPDIGAVVSIMY